MPCGAACVAALSPYATRDLDRFGTYTLNLTNPPEEIDYETPVVSPSTVEKTSEPLTLAG